MRDEFEKLRKKLEESIEKNGIDSERTKKISEKFDKMVVSYYKNEKQYHENSIMHIKYSDSMQNLKMITTDFAKFPTIEEWNHYAAEKELLCSESIKYISGNNWHNLRNRILTNSIRK